MWPDDLRPLCDKSAREAGTSAHPGARGNVLICCRSTNPALSFFLSSGLGLRSLMNFFPLTTGPILAPIQAAPLAFIVLMGLSEGHLTLFHLQMLTDLARALITPQAWPFHLHQGRAPLAARCTVHGARCTGAASAVGDELFIRQAGRGASSPHT